MKLADRAIECCVEYDKAKKRIDDLTAKIHDRFTACERRQREEMEPKEGESKYEFMERRGAVDPCLRFLDSNSGRYADWNCDDCEKALEYIRERKEARQEFGIAKRRVRAVARSYYKQEAEQ